MAEVERTGSPDVGIRSRAESEAGREVAELSEQGKGTGRERPVA